MLGTYAGTTVTETISYDPWGVPTYTGDLSSRVMWKGLMWEGGPATGDVVGLYYVRGRWYDPQAGRFVQEDPMGVDGGINVYTFAGDDPINGSDPSGMSPGAEQCIDLYNYAWVNGDPKGVSIQTVCFGGGSGDGSSIGGLDGGDLSHGGGGDGGNDPKQKAKPNPEAPSKKFRPLECAAAVAGTGITFAGDAAFFTGVGAGVRFAVIGVREAKLGAMFAEGAAQGLAHLHTSSALFGIASGSITGAVVTQWGPDGITNALMMGANHWRDFVPGFDLWQSGKNAIAACTPH